jgi:hypothetical protein
MKRLAMVLTVMTAAVLLQAGPAAASSWHYYGQDGLEVKSGDGKAQAFGHIRWYHGGFPKGYLHRGDYARKSKVRAIKSVGCIWAKVSYGYPNGDFTVGPGGPSGGVSGGSYSGHGFYVSCRKKGHKRPPFLGLYGIGYAKAFLNSSTLEVCSSRSKKQGPRFCSFEKNTY